MATNNSQQSGNGPPPKPWERAGGTSSGPAPFKPPSAGSTSDVVDASGTANPGEIVPTNDTTTNTLGRPVPSRPWQQQQTYGGAGYGSGLGYNSGYGAGGYGSYGGIGSYNSGLYGNSMYRGGYGGLYGGGTGGMYGGGMYGGGMYGGGMYNSGYGMGGMGMGMGMGMGGPGGPYGDEDPNNPFGQAPSQPPGFWISLMRVMQGFVTFFGRVAMLIDQNAQAFHMFMSALLQLFDRSGLLYGELARFVFRILGVKRVPPKLHPPGPNMPHGPKTHTEGPKGAPAGGGWDGVWGGN